MSDLDLVRISTAGSVDDGKSTLLGRLLFETKSIFEDQLEALERTSQHRGESEVNLALLTDGLKAEREQGITIDVAYRYFATPKKRFIIADTPGHRQYTRNMITGASTADAAIILIDARNGMTDQSKRHAFITSLLRLPQVAVVINKMDLIGFDEAVFNRIKEEFLAFSVRLRLPTVTFIPVSALHGDNVVEQSGQTPWYRGPSVLEYLENLSPKERWLSTDFRLPIQYVIRPNLNFRGYMGKIVSGSVRVGEELSVLPSGQKAKIAKLFDVEGPTEELHAGENALVTLDREVDISRGDMLVRPRNTPTVSQTFEAFVCWMSSEPANLSKPYSLRHTTREVSATIESIFYRIDVETLHRENIQTLEQNDIGRISLNTGRPVFLDTYEHNPATGGFILLDPVSNEVVAAGMVTRTDTTSTQPTKTEGCVVWLTGLSGAGKSTVGDALLERLKISGIQSARLDGDDLRTGLNSDLGFSPEDRTENLRRAAHVAALYSKLGNVTVCSFITPFNNDRRMIREILGDKYIEVYVKADLAECERRDPKGLYKRARAGEIREFTGIDSPFEIPESPDLTLDTQELTVDEAVGKIVGLIRARG